MRTKFSPMIKAFFLIGSLCTMLVGCDVRKKDKKAVIPAPKVITDPTTVQMIDSIYDFGKISEGEIVEYSYRFKNTGNKALLITEKPVASCGCTVAERPEEPIMPGDTGFIKIKFNSDNRPGETHKTITVSSNANPAFPVLELKGEVIGKQ